jgi:DNA-binding protein H-NS
MELDLNTLSLRELKELQVRVNRAVVTYEDRRKKEALAELEDKARQLGFSLSELLSGQPQRATRTRTGGGSAKFANPLNPSETWTGRGRKPKWFTEALAMGQTPDEMAVPEA